MLLVDQHAADARVVIIVSGFYEQLVEVLFGPFGRRLTEVDDVKHNLGRFIVLVGNPDYIVIPIEYT